MIARPGKLFALEFNEITWDLLDSLLGQGRLPHIRSLIEGGARGEPTALEAPPHLDPWVTWTTVYTGVPQDVHRITMLEQDRETLGAPRVWEHAAAAGRTVGLFGSANNWPPPQVDGYCIPGAFSRDYQTYPAELEPIQALNVGLTRGHTIAPDQRPNLKALLPKLVGLGLRPGTVARLACEVIGMKLKPGSGWRKVTLQPLVNFDFLARLYRRYQPDFATFHSNHVAYCQHRFWRAYQPERFEVPPTEVERATYAKAIPYAYEVADRVVGHVRRLIGPEGNLVILSSCGQKPATGGRYSEDQRHGHVGLQVRMKTLLSEMQLDGKVEYSNLMAPQWKLDFADEELQRATFDQLTSARNLTRDVAVFTARIEGRSICLSAVRTQEPDDELELPTPAGRRRIRAGDLLDRHAEAPKSGIHDPRGVLIAHGPGIRPGSVVKESTNLDLAPTMMTLLGLPVPSIMQGRVLEEILVAGAVSRPMAAV